MRAWLVAFVFTELVEVPIYMRFVRGRGRLLVAFGASALTHPIVWFFFPRFVVAPYWTMVALAEAFAVVVEAIYLASCGASRPFVASLVANAASASIGLASRALFGFP